MSLNKFERKNQRIATTNHIHPSTIIIYDLTNILHENRKITNLRETKYFLYMYRIIIRFQNSSLELCSQLSKDNM